MKRSGFTMIELIFVIVILGILAAVAIPKLAATRDDAKISSMATAIQTAKTELMSQVVATGTIPQVAANDAVDNTPATRGWDDFSNIVNEMYDGGTPVGQREVDNAAPANAGRAIVFQAEAAAGGARVPCITMEVNATDLEIRHNAVLAGSSPICEAVQTMVEPSIIAVRGSRVVY